MIEKVFHLKENRTTVRREIIAGTTTFMTIAYILAVNPTLLSQSGMDKNAVLIATALASFLGTLLMAFLANYPFVLVPGMGLNAYFAYTVCGSMGYSWQIALMAVFVEGIIFIILSVTHIREAIFNAIPLSLKRGVSGGIGLFIAFIGLQGAHLVVANESTLLSYVDFSADFHTKGICAILALIGLFITIILYIKRVKAAILIGILATWILGMGAQGLGLYVPNVSEGFSSLYPDTHFVSITAIGATFGQCFRADFSAVNVFEFLMILSAFLFVDLFDTIGTLIGVASKADMMDENHRLPRIRQAMLADAIATTAGAVLGTSTTTTCVESSAGVAAGGRTGLSSVVTGFLFLLSLFLAPVFSVIPSFATAPALILVGFLMISSIMDIDFKDLPEAIPAYLCLLVMPLMYSISEGISLGIISYVIINFLCGRREKITPLMYILALLFIGKYIFL